MATIDFEEVGGAADNDLSLDRVSPELAFSVLVDYAVRTGASDLFLCSEQDRVEVSIRNLGMIRTIAKVPSELGTRCMYHIRAAAGMKFDEHRKPQDGRLVRHRSDGRTIDLRLNTMPTMYGESFAIRILVRDSQLYDVSKVGLVGPQLDTLMGWLHSPSGLIVVTGPTGSGKTTTLYACLKFLNNGRRKIHTIEDPIEYALDGLRQSQVDELNGPSFEQLLRAVLRQGPDVVMIGEIRDQMTAETAIRAANSGQFVFASLHAPVAAGAIQSMLALGIHPHFLCSSLLGVIGQRLIRTLGSETKVRLDLSHAPRTFEEIGRWLPPDHEPTVYAAARQGESGDGPANEGYAGRTGVFELLSLTPAVRQRIAQGRPLNDISQQAIDDGMLDFRRASMLKVALGETSFDEILRVVPTAEQWVGISP
ncbi:MAG TPA: GspE/PulE family protein [Pirellulales bacterium]|nr:GspE/PulE family protein [Pirellulales bacterium]